MVMGAISLLSYPPEEVDKDKVDPNIVVIGFAVAGATGGAKAEPPWAAVPPSFLLHKQYSSPLEFGSLCGSSREIRP